MPCQRLMTLGAGFIWVPWPAGRRPDTPARKRRATRPHRRPRRDRALRPDGRTQARGGWMNPQQSFRVSRRMTGSTEKTVSAPKTGCLPCHVEVTAWILRMNSNGMTHFRENISVRGYAPEPLYSIQNQKFKIHHFLQPLTSCCARLTDDL